VLSKFFWYLAFYELVINAYRYVLSKIICHQFITFTNQRTGKK